MNGRNIAVLLVALLFAVGAGWMAMNFLRGQQEVIKQNVDTQRQDVPPPIPTTKVLVAKNDLAVGTFVRTEDLHWQEWPLESVVPSYVTDRAGLVDAGRSDEKKLTIDDFVGTVVRLPIAAGQPLSPGLVARAGERGFLAAVLRPGMRAVSVGISQISGVSGFILPGDRVDMMWSGQDPNVGGPFTQTIMKDLRVIAVDQATKADSVLLARSLTLEVTPKQAEAIILAGQLGMINFALRSIAPEDDTTESGSGSLLMASAGDGLEPGTLLGSALLGTSSVSEITDIELDTYTLTSELYFNGKPRKKLPTRGSGGGGGGQASGDGGSAKINIFRGATAQSVSVKN